MEESWTLYGYFRAWVAPYNKHYIQLNYMGEYLHFRYLKCLVNEEPMIGTYYGRCKNGAMTKYSAREWAIWVRGNSLVISPLYTQTTNLWI